MRWQGLQFFSFLFKALLSKDAARAFSVLFRFRRKSNSWALGSSPGVSLSSPLLLVDSEEPALELSPTLDAHELAEVSESLPRTDLKNDMAHHGSRCKVYLIGCFVCEQMCAWRRSQM